MFTRLYIVLRHACLALSMTTRIARHVNVYQEMNSFTLCRYEFKFDNKDGQTCKCLQDILFYVVPIWLLRYEIDLHRADMALLLWIMTVWQVNAYNVRQCNVLEEQFLFLEIFLTRFKIPDSSENYCSNFGMRNCFSLVSLLNITFDFVSFS